MRHLLLAALVLVAHAAVVVTAGLSDRPVPADVAVVLGTTVWPDGTLSDRLSVRTAAALQLYEEGLVRRVLVSGATGMEGVNEAEAMADWLVERGVPRRHVLVDPEGWDTWQTALHTREILDREGLTTVVAVTSYYHLPRTELALTRAGVTVVGTKKAELLWQPRELWSVTREVPALYLYALREAPEVGRT